MVMSHDYLQLIQIWGYCALGYKSHFALHTLSFICLILLLFPVAALWSLFYVYFLVLVFLLVVPYFLFCDLF